MAKSRYRIFALAIIVILAGLQITPGWAEVPVANVKMQIRNALLSANYYEECTTTLFRFGRRLDSSDQIWVKDNTVVRKIESPIWQQGEMISQNQQDYTYFIPAQNVALKTGKLVAIRELRLRDWRMWIEGASNIEVGGLTLGHETLLLTGVIKDTNFRFLVTRDSFLPVGLEVYRNNLLTRVIRFTRLDLNPPNFSQYTQIPGNVRWFANEKQFWQDVSIPRIQPAVSFPIMQPGFVPPGYVFQRATIEELSGATVAMLIYQGAEGTFALFEREKLSDQERFNLDSVSKDFSKRLGREIHAYQWSDKQVHLAILGPNSMDELKRIAASVK